MKIDGKVALVTGAGQGIGRGIALRLAKDGAHIGIVDMNEEKMIKAAKEVEALGRKAIICRADVSSRDEVFKVQVMWKKSCGFDIMINNAGIAQVNPRKKSLLRN